MGVTPFVGQRGLSLNLSMFTRRRITHPAWGAVSLDGSCARSTTDFWETMVRTQLFLIAGPGVRGVFRESGSRRDMFNGYVLSPLILLFYRRLC